MTLRSPTENEIALTLAVSPFDKAQGRRWNGRGNVSIRASDGYPRPLFGRGNLPSLTKAPKKKPHKDLRESQNVGEGH